MAIFVSNSTGNTLNSIPGPGHVFVGEGLSLFSFCLVHIQDCLLVTMSNPSLSSGQLVISPPASRQRCDGMNRRGLRCGRFVALTTPTTVSSSAPSPRRYCCIHQRIALNSQRPPRVLPLGALQRYLGNGGGGFIHSDANYELLALVPAYIEHCIRLAIGHDLMKGASPSDEVGHIYGFEAFGGCVFS